ncbi:hypothetical protein SERLA73DRAFT_163227 [Serpula lacrymans var. lacrymans S7.3]|uniref:Cytochrome P450 n=2 Tax=Serpula lacrymans var. lacrymans TaxID=341189 RepID=F8QCB6_SERL3|nr:uncharacterized protein SERLADRAFT_418471 [Serpula lacrymans var. lacrymans S7.9]EGN94235.1 hypothetical protein SERLA73DRAFT_163227 [Serpula lacrymans var. lacrymans S7.3]EGO19727.1 hypothetical protein SERLADRAFT_418471 [Serpula lacrymans var. lacrymans S7.9]
MSQLLPTLNWTAGFCAAVLLGILAYRRSSTSNSSIPLPPGPPRQWLGGTKNPKSTNVAFLFSKLVDEYGPVVSIKQGRKVAIIIGRHDAANEIMEKEGGALVDRPRLVAADEIVSKGMRLVLARSGDRFRRLRRAAHTHLQTKAAETYEPLQMHNAKNVILDILDDPKQHIMHARRYATSVILRVTYGKTAPTGITDPDMISIMEAVGRFQIVMRPGSFLVDRFPFLKYVPGYGRDLERRYKEDLKLYSGHMDRADGKAEACFMRYLIEHAEKHQLSNDEMAFLGGTFYAAGSDTTAAAIANMIMAAALHPEEQAKIQDELDMIVGSDRVPTFADHDMLPQLQAFVLETLRWRPITHLGFAHRATSDIIWKGYRIPAGATVYGVHWAITRDPVVFPDPERFNPQRWFDSEGKLRTDIKAFTFGFGRRACPGNHVANRSIYINAALLLWSFRFSQNPLAPIDSMAFEDSIVAHPRPFDVNFEPRKEEKVLRQMMEDYAKE